MSGPHGHPLPAEVRLDVPTGLVERAEALYAQQGLDDAALHEPGTQRRFRQALDAAPDTGWTTLRDRVRHLLDTPPHVALLRVPGGRASEPFLVAVAVALGTLADPYRTTWSRVLQPVAVRQDGSLTDARWHVDSPGWEVPNDITCLLCVRPSARGGETQVLPWGAFVAAATAAGAVAEAQRVALPWVLDEALGARTVRAPVVGPDGLRYMAESFERAAAAFPDEAPAILDLTGRLRDRLDAATSFYSVRLEAGDVLVLDNRRCLHRRGPLGAAGDERLLVRARVVEPCWTRGAPAPIMDAPGDTAETWHVVASGTPAGAGDRTGSR